MTLKVISLGSRGIIKKKDNSGENGNMKGIFRKLFHKSSPKSTPKSTPKKNDPIPESRDIAQEPKSPPLDLFIQRNANYDDDLSTLADPMPQMGSMTMEEAWREYGSHSVSSIDGDYKKAHFPYLKSSEASVKSVSSAGLTLGDNTYGAYSNMSQMGYSNASYIQDSATETSSYTQSLYSNRMNREETIHILAPPGKLGMSIETPNDGVVVVHAVKTTSPIVDRLKVGDRIVALDDEDVRFYTALKISKMISKKSSNKVRKLTIIRSIPNDSDEDEIPTC